MFSIFSNQKGCDDKFSTPDMVKQMWRSLSNMSITYFRTSDANLTSFRAMYSSYYKQFLSTNFCLDVKCIDGAFEMRIVAIFKSQELFFSFCFRREKWMDEDCFRSWARDRVSNQIFSPSPTIYGHIALGPRPNDFLLSVIFMSSVTQEQIIATKMHQKQTSFNSFICFCSLLFISLRPYISHNWRCWLRWVCA